MKHLAGGSRDAMQFWSTHYLALPLLFSIVKRILPAHPCSTDVERLFSVNWPNLFLIKVKSVGRYGELTGMFEHVVK
jgi:hypothetical protein